MRWRCRIGWVLLAAVAPLSSGCLAVAATAAAGAGAGYVYYQARATRSYPASLDATLQATQAALTDLGMPVAQADRKPESAYLQSRTGKDETVRIWLDLDPSRIPADGSKTQVTLRVSLLGDQDASRRILDQISYRLGAGGPETPPPPLASGEPPLAMPDQTQPPPPAPVQTGWRPTPVNSVPVGKPVETRPPPMAKEPPLSK